MKPKETSPHFQRQYETALRQDKDNMLSGGGALQCAWKAGYRGLKSQRYTAPGSMARAFYLAGKDRAKAEMKPIDLSPFEGPVGFDFARGLIRDGALRDILGSDGFRYLLLEKGLSASQARTTQERIGNAICDLINAGE